MAAGLFAGVINGVIVTVLNVNPIIATLGTLAAFDGLAFLIAPGGQAGRRRHPAGLHLAGHRTLPPGPADPRRSAAATGPAIPIVFVVFIIVATVMHVVMRYTDFGRSVYAIGGNATAARLAGINVRSVRIAMYLISGAIAGIAGVLLTAQTTSGNPINGRGLELQAITAVFLGGAATAGGRGTIVGTLLAVLLVGVLNNGMNLLGVGRSTSGSRSACCSCSRSPCPSGVRRGPSGRVPGPPRWVEAGWPRRGAAMTHHDPAPVRAWAEPVVIPTYSVMPPDRNPMFLEKRVYQGSSGRVYPNRITDRVSDDRVDQAWQAVHLENEFVRLMILPEIGGRIHVGQDKTNGYDFFYRQRVIKPALVGLLGPWISGGVEFNWPQHHRPSTFMPVDWAIEEEPDGSRTVWLGEHEPMQRMKGMVGIRLRPGSSVVEARARLYNRTPHAQTFLWWANVGVHVHDRYQSFFPPDVTYVADHARRAMSAFPVARGRYYGIDYGARPDAEADLSWYANIPVPTSYMVLDTEDDFFGGYDHEARAGLVHVADHQIAPGKKQWTWGSAEFGQAWDRNLTDEDGPYIELMAGVFTDNQPDFSWLAPYETRTFEQYWYPIREIGPAIAANTEVAVSLRVDGDVARFGAAATRRISGAQVVLSGPDGVLAEHRTDLAPDAPFTGAVDVPAGIDPAALRLEVNDGRRRVIEAHLPHRRDRPLPAPAAEPPAPEQVESVDELFLIGLHLEQYRHATRSPEPWWREALRRDPDDARTNTALAVRLARAGDHATAEPLLRRAIARLTALNPNPADGEPYYQLGLCLQSMGRLAEAEDAFAKATWSRPWQAAAAYGLAQLRGRAGDLDGAIRWTEEALAADARHATAGTLRAALLRRHGRAEEATAALAAILATDPLDRWAREEHRRASRAGGHRGEADGAASASPDDEPGASATG